MQLQYWTRDPPEADLDDEQLFEAIAVGIVPPRCMLGGALVEDIAKSGKVPCSFCPCPKRDVCTGGEQTASLPSFLHQQQKTLPNNETGARKFQRQRVITELNKLVRKEK